MIKFEKADYTGAAFLRNVFLCLSVIILFCFSLFSGFAFAAGCATPGQDGAGTFSGVVNTYYPGTASVSAGATSIPVGSSSGSATAIVAGNLLLIIQMQDADIAYSNDSNYGGSGTGSGYTNLNQTGYYEYAVAAGPVAGGFVSITGGLTYSYRYRAASGTSGQSRYQIIRVPQYTSATIAGTLSALNWNGSVGGIVAIDVAGTLTINGTVTSNGAGFRGGFGRTLTGGAGANTDYLTSYLVNANASKAEGIAGTPYYMNRPAAFDGAPVQVTGGSGYPNGTNANFSYARGAPGNAGGGGTDANPAANDQNSGGGGGGNYAAGAKGGNSWSSNLTIGGEGGGAVSGLAFNRIVMGGGGGAGTTNDGTADNATYTNPAGLACTAGAGACSSGAPGGGIVILRANSLTGAGTITANGGDGYNVQNDSAGGGGAGGAVVIYSYAGGSATASVNGGNGGNAWRAQAPGTPYPGARHGPGGAGSGGFIAYSPASLGVAMSYSAGISGATTTAADTYGSTSSSGGYSTFNSPNPPGVLPGAQCVPDLSTSTKTLVDLNGGDYLAGDTLQYSITIKETKGIAATGVSVTDAINANLINLTITSCPSGATCSYTAPTLSVSGISVPANGSVTIVYTAGISGSATPGTTITNTATITSNGIVVTAVAPVVTVSGYTTVTGNKPLYLYDNLSSPAWKLSRTPNTTSTNYATLLYNGGTQTWVMNPDAASAITINSTISTTVPVTLYLSRNTTPGTRNVRVDLQCSSGGTILTQTQTGLTLTTTPTAFAFALPLLGSLTCGQGYHWNLTVTNTTTNSGRTVYVYPQYNTNPSRVNLPATTVINVDSIGFYNGSYAGGGTAVTSIAPGATVYIQAKVSDPFGSYDIVNPPTITIKNPSGVTVISGANMIVTSYTNSSSKIYEYAFPVQWAYPFGNWSVSVTAIEGTEATPVTDTAYATMPVVTTSLTIVKYASPVSAAPGDTITYTETITNTGTGPAASVIVTDSLSPYVQLGLSSYSGVPFQFVNGAGANASGLTLGTPVYSNDHGATWAYVPSGTYDGNVTNWSIPMSGTMNANGANFTINYKVRVK